MTPFPTAAPDVLARLRQFDTPTVCNVLELFDCRPRTAGYMDGRIAPATRKLPPMVGYASTATFRSGSPPRAGDVYAGLDEQVGSFAELPGPAVVVFQDLDDPAVAATFGEVMCTTYKAFGAAGLITSGAGRDLDQVEALDFPCFTGGTICSHGYCQIVDSTCRCTSAASWFTPATCCTATATASRRSRTNSRGRWPRRAPNSWPPSRSSWTT